MSITCVVQGHYSRCSSLISTPVHIRTRDLHHSITEPCYEQPTTFIERVPWRVKGSLNMKRASPEDFERDVSDFS